MKLLFDVIKISQFESEEIQYDKVIFKIRTGKSITIENAKELRIFLQTLFKGGALKYIIDMDELKMIDSSGMGEFINFTKHIRVKGGDLVFLNISQEILKIFKVVNLEKFIKSYDSEKEVVRFFSFV